jgi:hypothetical protein
MKSFLYLLFMLLVTLSSPASAKAPKQDQPIFEFPKAKISVRYKLITNLSELSNASKRETPKAVIYWHEDSFSKGPKIRWECRAISNEVGDRYRFVISFPQQKARQVVFFFEGGESTVFDENGVVIKIFEPQGITP